MVCNICWVGPSAFKCVHVCRGEWTMRAPEYSRQFGPSLGPEWSTRSRRQNSNQSTAPTSVPQAAKWALNNRRSVQYAVWMCESVSGGVRVGVRLSAAGLICQTSPGYTSYRRRSACRPRCHGGFNPPKTTLTVPQFPRAPWTPSCSGNWVMRRRRSGRKKSAGFLLVAVESV